LLGHRRLSAGGARLRGAGILAAAAGSRPCPTLRPRLATPPLLSALALFAVLPELLAQPGLDAIYVATPNHSAREAVEAAAAASKPVLCEKPMRPRSPTPKPWRRVKRAGVLYGTAFDQRHHPAHGAMRDAIAAGLLGRVTAVRIAYCCWVDACWTADNWRADPARAGGGALMDLAPHGLDLVHFLTGEPLADIAALTQARVQDYSVDDGAVLIGRTAGGVLAQMHVSYNCPEALPRRRLEVLGTRGQLLALNTMGQTPGGSVSFIDGATGEARPLPVPDPLASPFARQMAAFGRAVAGGDRSPFDVERDLGLMRLLDRAYRTTPPCR
jgi:predicted dehydrogenase